MNYKREGPLRAPGGSEKSFENTAFIERCCPLVTGIDPSNVPQIHNLADNVNLIPSTPRRSLFSGTTDRGLGCPAVFSPMTNHSPSGEDLRNADCFV
jgi:hypothetical protein